MFGFFCHLLCRVEGSPHYGLFSVEGDTSSIGLVLGGAQAVSLGEDKVRIQNIEAELVSAVQNISMDPEWGEMNEQEEWNNLEIVLPFELHSGKRHTIRTLEELSNSQETST